MSVPIEAEPAADPVENAIGAPAQPTRAGSEPRPSADRTVRIVTNESDYVDGGGSQGAEHAMRPSSRRSRRRTDIAISLT